MAASNVETVIIKSLLSVVLTAALVQSQCESLVKLVAAFCYVLAIAVLLRDTVLSKLTQLASYTVIAAAKFEKDLKVL